MRSLALLAAIAVMASAVPAGAQELVHFPAPAGEEARLTINAVSDVSAMAPLIEDFQQTAPGIAVDYHAFTDNDFGEAADRACLAGQPFGDLLITSAVDQLVQYANDGCALGHESEATRAIANTSTYWRNEVFGFSFEPVVIVYNADAIEAADVPRTRGELADLLRREQDYFSGKVATYDLRQSGTGYLFAFLDSEQSSTAYGRLLESFGRVGVRLECCSSDILEAVASGDVFLAYNVLGSHAYAAARSDPSIRIVLPRDYTLVLHRAAAIPRHAAHPDLAKLFLDYLLSPRGQAVGIDQSFFFSRDGQIPPGVDGPSTLMTSGIGRTIVIRPTLLVTQDAQQRRRFIEDWAHVVTEQAQ